MDSEQFFIFKGLIECKPETKDGQASDALFLSFCALSSAKEMLMFEVGATAAPLDTSMPWHDYFDAIMGAKAGDGEGAPFLSYAETQLIDYMKANNLLAKGVKQGNAKPLEGELLKFAAQKLGKRAVAVVKLEEPDAQTVEKFLKIQDEQQREDLQPEEDKAAVASNKVDTMIVKCFPVLDPVKGVAIGELKVSDSVMVAMEEGSFLYNIFKDKMPDFNGVVTGEVTEIKPLDTGGNTLKLHLAEGIIGMTHMSKNTRIKVPPKTAPQDSKASSTHIVMFSVIGIAAIMLMMVLYLIFR